MGTSAKAWGNQSIAFGLGANAGVQTNTAVPNDIAVGVNARATGGFSVALGTSATATADSGTAIGNAAAASGLSSASFGHNASASGQNAVAVGFQARSTGLNSLYLGSRSIAGTGALASSSVAIGQDVTSSGVNAVAIGVLSNASGADAFAGGRQATASSDAATAVGNAARALGNSSLALGAQAAAVGASTVAVGQGAGAGSTTANTGSIALGIASGALVTGAQNTAIGGGIASVQRGAGSGVTGTRNVALGVGDGTVAYDATLDAAAGSLVSGNDNVAIGTNAGIGVATNATTSIGLNANASAANAIAMGTSAVANSADAVAIGTGSTATGGRAVAIGAGNFASGNGAVAIGDPNTASGNGAIASGLDNTATGNGSVAMGNTNMVGGGGQAVSTPGTAAQGAVGIGYQNQVIGQGSVAIGSTSRALAAGAVAFGDTAVANNVGDVALGSGSVTAVAVATPSTVIDGVTYNFAGSNPTRTVSVGAVGTERTITNVAAGRISGTSTDAINGSQLYATNQAIEAVATTATAGWNITDGTNSGNIAPNETLTMAAGSNATVAYNDATGTMTVGVVADPSFNSVTVGDTVINDGSISFTSGGPSITNVGINAGGTTITNVAGAVNGTDAVNLDQVTNLVDGVATHYYSVNDNGVQGGNYANDGASGINALAAGVSASSTAAQGVALGNSASVTIDGGVALGSGSLSDRALAPASGNIIAGTGLVPYNTSDKTLLGAVSVGTDTSYRQITNVADGTQAQDAVTVRQLQGAIGSISATGTRYFHANSTAPDSLAVGAESIAVGPTTVVNGDNGIGMGNGALVQQTAPGGIAIGQSSEVSFADGIALGTNSTSNGIQSLALGAGSTANEPGSVALGAGSATAVAVQTASTVIAGATYNFAGTTPTSTISVGAVGGERTITNVAAGRISGSSTDAINGSQLFATNQAIDAISTTANAGWNVSAQGANVTNVAPSETVDLSNSDGNIVVSKTATDDNVTFDLADDIAVNSVTMGGTVLNANGLTIVGGPSITTTGISAGGTTITNVAPGVAGTDAANIDQLNAVSNIVNAGWNITDGTNSGNIAPAETLTVAAGNNATVAYDDATGTMTVGVVANPSFSSITIGNTFIDNSGLTIAGGPSITNVGINGGGTTITNVAAGVAGTDVVNVDQLNQTVAANLTRYYSVNDNGVQGGNYNNDGASGINALAAGVGATSTAAQGVALGNNASVTTNGGVALGAGSLSDRVVAPASGNVTAGTHLIPYNTTDKTLLGAVSVGTDTSYRQITNVADGTEDQDAVTLRQLRNGLSSFAVSPIQYFHANSTAADSLAVGAESVAIGPSTVVNGDNGIGMGNGALVQQTAPGGIAIGQDSTVSFADGIALGTNAVSNGIQSLALGAGATANEPGSVALGAGSTTSVAVATPSVVIGGTTYNFAGVTPASTISVGGVGTERTITNVAAGRISDSSTDAINGSQLFATNQAIENLTNTVNASAPHYYSVNDGGVQGGNYNNDGATATGAIASGVNASATAADAVAIGSGATSGFANSVALGAGSTTAAAVGTASATIAGTTYNFAGAAPAGTVSVGDAGAERTVTNVAAGRISDTSTDAINGSQLYATNRAVNQIDGRVTNLENSITNIVNNGGSPVFQVGGNTTTVATASGNNSAAGGSNAVASGNSSTAVGGNSTASADNSTALGNGATAAHTNSVALGSGSATTVGAQNNYNGAYVGNSNSTGEVNVGGRTITGVAPGIAGTDAVNVNQLNAGVDQAVTRANQYTDSRLAQLDNDVWTLERGYRGATSSAMAMAGLPQAYLPGKSMVSVGFGGYQGEYGMAFGLSGITENGRYVYKAQASGNTTRDWGFSVGAGIQW